LKHGEFCKEKSRKLISYSLKEFFGDKIFVDTTLVNADASAKSIVTRPDAPLTLLALANF